MQATAFYDKVLTLPIIDQLHHRFKRIADQMGLGNLAADRWHDADRIENHLKFDQT